MVPERNLRLDITRLLVVVKLCSTIQALRYCSDSKVKNAGIQCPSGGTPGACAANTKDCCFSGSTCLSLDTTPKNTCPFNSFQPTGKRVNRALMGHVTMVRHVTSNLQCADQCFCQAWCVGYNYELVRNYNKQVCELLSMRSGDVYRPGFAFNLLDHDKTQKEWLQNTCTSQS